MLEVKSEVMVADQYFDLAVEDYHKIEYINRLHEYINWLHEYINWLHEYINLLMGFMNILIGFMNILIGFINLLIGFMNILIGFMNILIGFINILIGFINILIGIKNLITNWLREYTLLIINRLHEYAICNHILTYCYWIDHKHRTEVRLFQLS